MVLGAGFLGGSPLEVCGEGVVSCLLDLSKRALSDATAFLSPVGFFPKWVLWPSWSSAFNSDRINAMVCNVSTWGMSQCVGKNSTVSEILVPPVAGM